MTLEEYSVDCHETSASKGFYDDYDGKNFKDQALKLCLIHSEVTEVMESLRKEKGVEETEAEMADIFIRLADFWAALKEHGYVERSFDDVVDAKMEKNRGRPHMHGVLG